MNRMIRSVCSTLGTALVLSACPLPLLGQTAEALNQQEFGGAKHRERDPDSLTFTQIDVPGATTTSALGINNRDEIVGIYVNANGAQHGFLLDDGVFVRDRFPGRRLHRAHRN